MSGWPISSRGPKCITRSKREGRDPTWNGCGPHPLPCRVSGEVGSRGGGANRCSADPGSGGRGVRSIEPSWTGILPRSRQFGHGRSRDRGQFRFYREGLPKRMKRLNVAIVGCGIISGAHIQGWQRNRERARIVACCDTSIERARKAAEAAVESEARAVTDCEKPLALTPEDCDRMMAAARAAGVILMHGENMRTAENAERAAETIRAGRLGTIVGLQATYAHWQR